MRKSVRRQMLALVVLESLREAKPRIAQTHVRTVVAAARDAIESEHGENLKRRIVDRSRRPRVARQLSARSVVRFSAKDSDARRIDASIFCYYVADDVVRKCRDDLVARGMEALREVCRAVE